VKNTDVEKPYYGDTVIVDMPQ